MGVLYIVHKAVTNPKQPLHMFFVLQPEEKLSFYGKNGTILLSLFSSFTSIDCVHDLHHVINIILQREMTKNDSITIVLNAEQEQATSITITIKLQVQDEDEHRLECRVPLLFVLTS